MARYKLSAEAKQDLKNIHCYGALKFGTKQAEKYYRGLFQRFDEIAAHPHLYQAVEHIRDNYRRSVFESHSIYYRMNGAEVEIMAIIGQQDF